MRGSDTEDQRVKGALLEEWDRKYVWHPFTQMQDYEKEIPLIIDRAEDIWLIDIYGKRYIDGVSSLWVNVHGHCVPEVDRAIIDQLQKVAHTTLLGLGSVPSIELAKFLVDIAPKGLSKVFYSDSGSTAAEISIKMAYQYWQQIEGSGTKKVKFAHIKNAYHGDTLGAVSVGGIDLFHKIYKPLLFETIFIPFEPSYRFEGSETEWVVKNMEYLQQTVVENRDQLAGIIVEPLIQGASGMQVFPRGYLKRVRELCDEYDILMIVDEVATGFGRTGELFACNHEKVSPDMMLLAKGLSAGYLPLAVTMTNEKIYQAFLGEYQTCKTFFHGHTYTGNPLACAAAIANLKLMQEKKLVENVSATAKKVKPYLENFLTLPCVGDVRQVGFMIGIEMVTDKVKKSSCPLEKKMSIKVIQKARELGAIIRPLGDVIVIMPPLSISFEHFKNLLDITYRSIKEVCDKENFVDTV